MYIAWWCCCRRPRNMAAASWSNTRCLTQSTDRLQLLYTSYMTTEKLIGWNIILQKLMYFLNYKSLHKILSLLLRYMLGSFSLLFVQFTTGILTLFSSIYCGLLPYIGNHPQKKKFVNFANLGAFANVFLHFLISARIFIYEIAWIAKVFSRTMVKKVICETFLLRMIPDIW